MPEEPELVLWTEGIWRCEYRNTDGTGELRLYYGAAIMRSVTVKGGTVAVATASDWRTTVVRGTIKKKLVFSVSFVGSVAPFLRSVASVSSECVGR